LRVSKLAPFTTTARTSIRARVVQLSRLDRTLWVWQFPDSYYSKAPAWSWPRSTCGWPGAELRTLCFPSGSVTSHVRFDITPTSTGWAAAIDRRPTLAHAPVNSLGAMSRQLIDATSTTSRTAATSTQHSRAHARSDNACNIQHCQVVVSSGGFRVLARRPRTTRRAKVHISAIP
jgi:hypothetical protein